jgi:hypothetical protein
LKIIEEEEMKYVTLWEMNMASFPVDQGENTKIMMKLVEMTKQWAKDHPNDQWGKFLGENRGYSIMNGSQEDVMKISMMFSPYVEFKVYQSVSIDEVDTAMKSMMAMMMQPK